MRHRISSARLVDLEGEVCVPSVALPYAAFRYADDTKPFAQPGDARGGAHAIASNLSVTSRAVARYPYEHYSIPAAITV